MSGEVTRYTVTQYVKLGSNEVERSACGKEMILAADYDRDVNALRQECEALRKTLVDYMDASQEARRELIKQRDQARRTVARLQEALKLSIDTLSYVQHVAPGYDWNADRKSLTLKTGEAFEQAKQALAAAEEGLTP